MKPWITSCAVRFFSLWTALATADPSAKFTELKSTIDTRQLEATHESKKEETNNILSDVEFTPFNFPTL